MARTSTQSPVNSLYQTQAHRLSSWLQRAFRKLPSLLIAAIGIVLLSNLAAVPQANGANPVQEGSKQATSSLNYKFFLHYVAKGLPLQPPIFGVESKSLSPSPSVIKAVEAQARWMRYNAFSWEKIEPVRTEPPTYNWGQVEENRLQNAIASGLTIIATVKFTPSWAQKIPGKSCGPIAAEAFDEFAQFMQALVQRYGAPPYNIKYWELGNEVDADWTLAPPDNIYGCWGDKNDPYFGGGYYASMLQVVYPAIKAADPEAKVLNGGFLLDCDPNNPPSGTDCLSGKFFEGMLRNQGGQYLDYVSYHSFPVYYLGRVYDEEYPNWSHLGGMVLGKAKFLRQLMQTYGVYRPLMLTEASLVCPDYNPTECSPPGDMFYQAQADYVPSLFVRSWAAGISTTIWFTIEDNNWRACSLLNSDGFPKPAYDAYHFMTQEIGNARLVGPVVQYPGIQGYAFYKGTMYIWILWSPNRTNQNITLPGNVLQIYDKYGNPLIPANGQLTVNSPVYIELMP